MRHVMMIGLALLYAAPANAGSSDFRTQIRDHSQQEALDARPLPSYRLLRGKARPQLESELRQGLVAENLARSAGDPDWQCVVSPDGTEARLSRVGATEGKGTRWGLANRPTVADLETGAYAAAIGTLGRALALAANEELRPWRVEHRILGSGTAKQATSTEVLAGSTLIFTRVIEGVPVLGGLESKVSVEFNTDGVIVELAYNWRPLQRGATVKTVTHSEVLRRAQVLKETRGAGTAADSLECGYIVHDQGAVGTTLEPACADTYEVKRSGMRQRYVDVIPLAETTLPAPTWPETVLLDALSR